jgi:uncharacterized membrane protein YdjX (TVP38/TMEM64 family)
MKVERTFREKLRDPATAQERSRWRREWTRARNNPRFWLSVAGVIAAGLALVAIVYFTDWDWADLHDAMQRLPTALAIALMALLPLTGFSVAVVYLVAGAKFGPVLGGVVVAGVTVIHLLGSYWISRGVLRRPLERFMAKRHHALPRVRPNAHVSVALMAALVPGLPYFVRNYLLPLSGIPLRVYFWVCLPVYVARSYVTIFLGDLSGQPSLRRLLILGAILTVKLTICAIIVARLRRREWLATEAPREK